MKKSYTSFFILGLLIFFIGIEGSFAKNKQIVAILDSPIDFKHANIKTQVDSNLMKIIGVDLGNGLTLSWYDYNEMSRSDFFEKMDVPSYFLSLFQLRAQDYLSQHRSVIHYFLPNIPQVLEDLRQAMTKLSPQYQSKWSNISVFLHGTYVADLVSRGNAGDFGIITYPLFKPEFSEEIDENSLRLIAMRNAFDTEEGLGSDSVQQELKKLAETLAQNSVSTVNMSFSVSYQSSLRRFLGLLTPEAKDLYQADTRLQKDIQEYLAKTIQLRIDSFHHLIRSNPETVFVLAAENLSLDIAKQNLTLARIKEPNLLKVAAIKGDGHLADFSSYSQDYVDVAALGVGVRGALTGGGQLKMSGTSVATPFVTNTIVKIRSEHPEMSASESIQFLLEHHTRHNRHLDGKVVGGRELWLDTSLFEDVLDRNNPPIQLIYQEERLKDGTVCRSLFEP